MFLIYSMRNVQPCGICSCVVGGNPRHGPNDATQAVARNLVHRQSIDSYDKESPTMTVTSKILTKVQNARSWFSNLFNRKGAKRTGFLRWLFIEPLSPERLNEILNGPGGKGRQRWVSRKMAFCRPRVEVLEERIVPFGSDTHVNIVNTALSFLQPGILGTIATADNAQDNLYSPTSGPGLQAANHFDNSQFTQGAAVINQNLQSALGAAGGGDFTTDVAASFGAALHGAQDFYAHSNWVETYLAAGLPSMTNGIILPDSGVTLPLVDNSSALWNLNPYAPLTSIASYGLNWMLVENAPPAADTTTTGPVWVNPSNPTLTYVVDLTQNGTAYHGIVTGYVGYETGDETPPSLVPEPTHWATALPFTGTGLAKDDPSSTDPNQNLKYNLAVSFAEHNRRMSSIACSNCSRPQNAQNGNQDLGIQLLKQWVDFTNPANLTTLQDLWQANNAPYRPPSCSCFRSPRPCRHRIRRRRSRASFSTACRALVKMSAIRWTRTAPWRSRSRLSTSRPARDSRWEARGNRRMNLGTAAAKRRPEPCLPLEQ